MGQIGARRVATIRAPRLPADAGPWFNASPLGGWRGVTLVDFWTYACINCLRAFPALRAWHGRYAAHGLTILGVHTPEFSFERDPTNVARALQELGIAYPVVLDNDRAIWGAFANRAWPHRYLIDAHGRIVHDHAGEGGEVATERALRAALTTGSNVGSLPTPVYPSTGPIGPSPSPTMRRARFVSPARRSSSRATTGASRGIPAVSARTYPPTTPIRAATAKATSTSPGAGRSRPTPRASSGRATGRCASPFAASPRTWCWPRPRAAWRAWVCGSTRQPHRARRPWRHCRSMRRASIACRGRRGRRRRGPTSRRRCAF